MNHFILVSLLKLTAINSFRSERLPLEGYDEHPPGKRCMDDVIKTTVGGQVQMRNTKRGETSDAGEDREQ